MSDCILCVRSNLSIDLIAAIVELIAVFGFIREVLDLPLQIAVDVDVVSVVDDDVVVEIGNAVDRLEPSLEDSSFFCYSNALKLLRSYRNDCQQ